LSATSKAVPQLLYPGTTDLKWHFPQENDTLHTVCKGTLIVEPLYENTIEDFAHNLLMAR
jgi:hypothetical protein